jgi:hypothetical protein
MPPAHTLKPLLKRGALVAAANWEVVAAQFIAESAFKLLLAVPVIGAAFLVALLVGGSALDLAAADVRQVLGLVLGALVEHPGALAAYVLGVLVVVVGGAAMTFLVKGGTVAVLVQAERHAPAVEEPPLRSAVVRRAGIFTLERFMHGCARFFSRYLALGLLLLGVYVLVGVTYLAVVLGTYRVVAARGPVVGWTFVATVLSGGLVLGVTVINLLYLLTQLTVAVDNCGLRAAMARVGRFLRADLRTIAIVFAAMLAVVGLATVASILATAGLGFIGFIPVIGLTVLPLQLAAWIARGLIFQYLGLAALGAYARLYRGSVAARAASAQVGHAPARMQS